MNRRTRPIRLAAHLLLLTGISVLSACSSSSSVSPGVSPELKHSWEVNFNRGDGAAVASLYAPDAQLIMSGSEPVRGAAAIRAAIDSMIKSGVKVHIDSSENVGAGDIAYVFGTYSVLDPEHQQTVERGSYVEVWRRRNGEWKITIDINAAGAPVRAEPPQQ
jgi:uncharacterized protein (TIGR02246 family)